MAESAAMLQDRMRPNNLEAEKAVLGGMLRDNKCIGDVVQVLKENHFHMEGHRILFKAITQLYDLGHPVDLVLLSDKISLEKQVEKIGGYGYLAQLWDATPTSANTEYHARIVRDKAILRDLIDAGNEILTEAYHQSAPADQVLEQAEKKIFQIAEYGVTGQTYTLEQAIRNAADRIDHRHAQGNVEDSISGLSTGFIDLDNITAGLQESELVIIAARPSMGKTAVALNLAYQVAQEKHGVFFVSLEQSRTELAERLLCIHARIDGQKLRKGRLSSQEIDRIHVAMGELSDLKFFIDDSPGQSMMRISANARRLKLRNNLKMVMVDYLQLVEPDNRRDPRQEQVAGISRRLKALAKELHVPVVALAQLNRGPEDRSENRPRLSDLRESGAIEQDADTVMLLHRPEYYNPDQDAGLMEIIIGKQRNGPTGDVRLTFIKQFMRLENYQAGIPFV